MKAPNPAGHMFWRPSAHIEISHCKLAVQQTTLIDSRVLDADAYVCMLALLRHTFSDCVLHFSLPFSHWPQLRVLASRSAADREAPHCSAWAAGSRKQAPRDGRPTQSAKVCSSMTLFLNSCFWFEKFGSPMQSATFPQLNSQDPLVLSMSAESSLLEH